MTVAAGPKAPTSRLRMILGVAVVLHAVHWMLLRSDSSDPLSIGVLIAAILVEVVWAAGLVVLVRPSTASPGDLLAGVAALAAGHLAPPHGRTRSDWAWFAITVIALGAAGAAAIAVWR